MAPLGECQQLLGALLLLRREPSLGDCVRTKMKNDVNDDTLDIMASSKEVLVPVGPLEAVVSSVLR